LSNDQTGRVRWLVGHHAALVGAPSAAWSASQRILIAEGIEDLLALLEAAASAGYGQMTPEEMAWCRAKLAQPREVLNPPPLLTGDDLIRHGVPTGPAYRHLLEQVRNAQLDGEIHAKDDALALVDRLLEAGDVSQD
jgi:hypothetical protein